MTSHIILEGSQALIMAYSLPLPSTLCRSLPPSLFQFPIPSNLNGLFPHLLQGLADISPPQWRPPGPPPHALFICFIYFSVAQLSPGEGNGNPLQYSCLENPMDWGAWWAAVHGVTQSRTWLSDFTFTFPFMHWRKWHPSPVFLPGESQGRGSLVGCRLWGPRVGHDWSDLAAAAAAATLCIRIPATMGAGICVLFKSLST